MFSCSCALKQDGADAILEPEGLSVVLNAFAQVVFDADAHDNHDGYDHEPGEECTAEEPPTIETIRTAVRAARERNPAVIDAAVGLMSAEDQERFTTVFA